MRLLLLFFVFDAFTLRGQTSVNSFTPNSPVTADISLKEYSQTDWQKLYDEKKPQYSQNQVNDLINMVKLNNQGVEQELEKINIEASNLYIKFFEVAANKNVSEFQKLITARQQSIEETKKELSISLSNIRFPGMYVVLLQNVDVYDSKPNLQQKARAAMEPDAVNNLIGTQIERLTHVESYNLVTDVIKSFTGGEIAIDKVLYDAINSYENARYFVYLAKIDVKPLASLPPTRIDYGLVKAVVIDVFKDKDYELKLKKLGVSDQDILKLVSEVKSYDLTVSQNLAEYMQQSLILSAKEKIFDIENEITELRNKIKHRETNLIRLCKELNIPFDASDLERSGNNAIKFINNKITELDVKWNITKEREIVFKETDVKIESSAAEIFAAGTEGLLNQMSKNYNTVHKPFQSITIENNQVSDFKEGRIQELYRQISNVWCYPMGQGGSSFHLLVLARFKIIKININPDDSISGYEPEMISLPAGRFSMGSLDKNEDERPVHTVFLTGFMMSKYEITQKQWKEIMGNNPSANLNCLDCPVENVSFYDVLDFLKKLNALTGKNFRLPTEAEWEYAARDVNKPTITYANGRNVALLSEMNIDEKGNFLSRGKPIPVGSLKTPNKRGFHDMSGNVAEWCMDKYNEFFYSKSTGASNPLCEDGNRVVVRGGSYYRYAEQATVSVRGSAPPEKKYPHIGFRIVLSSKKQ